jgi:poly(ADP-ribose) glycohydrolase
MSFFPLPSYDENKWSLLKEEIEQSLHHNSIESVRNLIKSIGGISGELKSFDYILECYKETDLIPLFNSIKLFSLNLPTLFPSSTLPRLAKHKCNLIELTREQILCILCHMFLCSVEKTPKNMYWVNFEKWLVDGRVCANAYLTSLVEYFLQSFAVINAENEENKSFMRQTVRFERRSLDSQKLEACLSDESLQLSCVHVKSEGSIGESSNVEVDFANCDIGYGVTGTQEEILFGASPEMCIAMLFADTMQADEAIVIRGARRVAQFDGYGLTLCFKHALAIDSQDWSERVVIAIDSLDYSDCETSLAAFREQLKESNLRREVSKAFAGFSSVHGKTIDTGNWGCGAFCGNRQLKALIQVVAASANGDSLNFYCFRDKTFGEELAKFVNVAKERHVGLRQLWSLINALGEIDYENGVFEAIMKNF